MPFIQPTAGDKIHVTVQTTIMTAEIKSKGTDGKWEIELAGDPPLHGKIDIAQYEWQPRAGAWEIPTKVEHRITDVVIQPHVDVSIQNATAYASRNNALDGE